MTDECERLFDRWLSYTDNHMEYDHLSYFDQEIFREGFAAGAAALEAAIKRELETGK